ncbi:Hypothetical protein SRAE_1000064100 [Strongyloides ratti]|uniref:Uncharacterized protein n=1 Tax=Strongyloides ratti TaxID=34506 RepID=A0A090MUQ7_STRRB|nr:Hypothetical protein SRAE_1000064100 [Strongyloides ratti]CEF62368.1 Hypothetical protein SRAE_1000064100 [Strongyloides ratti]
MKIFRKGFYWFSIINFLLFNPFNCSSEIDELFFKYEARRDYVDEEVDDNTISEITKFWLPIIIIELVLLFSLIIVGLEYITYYISGDMSDDKKLLRRQK